MMVKSATTLILRAYQQPRIPFLRWFLKTRLGAIAVGMVRPALSVPPGVALVLYRQNEPPITIRGGSDSAQSLETQHLILDGVNRWAYPMIFEVNTANCSFGFQCSLPSKDGAFRFNAAVEASCEVVDPQAIVEKRISDAQAVLRPLIVQMMRDISWKYDIRQAADAEKEINEVGAGLVYDFGIKITRFTASLDLPASAIDHITQQQQMEERHDSILHNGVWDILNWHMADPNDIRALGAAIHQIQQKAASDDSRKSLEGFLERDRQNGVYKDGPSPRLAPPAS